MARKGIIYHDVQKAAESIKSQEQSPTIDRVRALLGTGSKSTIGPLLKRWRLSDEENNFNKVKGIPNALLCLVQQLNDHMQSSADQKINEMNRSCDERITQLHQETQTLNETLSTSIKNENHLKDHVKALQKDNKNLQLALRKANNIVQKNQMQIENMEQNLSELKAQRLEFKEEIKQIRNHFEHYQTQVAIDRQIERDQHRTLQSQSDLLISQLEDDIALFKNQIKIQIESLNELKSSIKENEEHQKTMENSLQKKDKTIQKSLQYEILLKEKAHKKESDYNELSHHYEKLLTDLTHFKNKYTKQKEKEKGLQKINRDLDKKQTQLLINVEHLTLQLENTQKEKEWFFQEQQHLIKALTRIQKKSSSKE
jgi:chromosome segregation ATPase